MDERYLCIHKGEKLLRECDKCTGATSLCGKYENISGLDPFTLGRPKVKEIMRSIRNKNAGGKSEKNIDKLVGHSSDIIAKLGSGNRAANALTKGTAHGDEPAESIYSYDKLH